MIYKYQKFKSLKDFIDGYGSKNFENYTILNKCNGIDYKEKEYSDCCFGCLFCVENQEMLDKIENHFGDEFVKKYATNAFDGKPVKLIKSKNSILSPYNSFDKFTAIAETTNIQPWVAGIFNNMIQNYTRISMEIPILNLDYDRNGRLDVGILSEELFIAIETKTSLDDALKDERFVEQRKKYVSEIEKYCKDYVYFTVLGGLETDLYPITNKYSTGVIGDKAQRFHKICIENNIKFLSAEALLMLYSQYVKKANPKLDPLTILKSVYDDPKCIGLVSAGKLVVCDNNISILEVK